jgi:hypothetical protein
MPADAVQLNGLKDILRLFSASTGLQVNFHKTTIVPINIDTDHAQALAQSFGCKVESLPFIYLGLPLGTTRPSVNDLMPLVSKLDKRLSGISSLMTYTGRLTLLNSVINSLPMFAMCHSRSQLPSLFILRRVVDSSYGMIKMIKSMVNALPTGIWYVGQKIKVDLMSST